MSVQNKTFNVEGISSAEAAELVKSSLMVLNGVFDVIVDINARRVAVEYDDERLSYEIIRETIEDKGFKIK
ncbi:MAG TPA: heavy-metal-associated domain-containing protein [Clostridiaceae bacterium]|nr:heavy-metal-associated domain-containing protein [Clostridiaceae bacterium]